MLESLCGLLISILIICKILHIFPARISTAGQPVREVIMVIISLQRGFFLFGISCIASDLMLGLVSLGQGHVSVCGVLGSSCRLITYSISGMSRAPAGGGWGVGGGFRHQASILNRSMADSDLQA